MYSIGSSNIVETDQFISGGSEYFTDSKDSDPRAARNKQDETFRHVYTAPHSDKLLVKVHNEFCEPSQSSKSNRQKFGQQQANDLRLPAKKSSSSRSQCLAEPLSSVNEYQGQPQHDPATNQRGRNQRGLPLFSNTRGQDSAVSPFRLSNSQQRNPKNQSRNQQSSSTIASHELAPATQRGRRQKRHSNDNYQESTQHGPHNELSSTMGESFQQKQLRGLTRDQQWPTIKQTTVADLTNQMRQGQAANPRRGRAEAFCSSNVGRQKQQQHQFNQQPFDSFNNRFESE